MTDAVPAMLTCGCCGAERDPSTMAALRCRQDVSLCRGCIEWLRAAAGGVIVTPTLPVVDMDQAVAFYEAVGFEVARYEGGGFAFVRFDTSSVFDLDLAAHIDPAANGAGCYLIVADVDGWHGRLVAAGVPVTAVEDMPWGIREFSLTDPSGNTVRFGAGTAS